MPEQLVIPLETARQAIQDTHGRIFRVTFFKRTDGTLRNMVCRTGVRKGVKGIGLAFAPDDYALAVVYDLAKHEHRMVNLDAVTFIKCGKSVWEI